MTWSIKMYNNKPPQLPVFSCFYIFGGCIQTAVSCTSHGVSGRDLFKSYGIETTRLTRIYLTCLFLIWSPLVDWMRYEEREIYMVYWLNVIGIFLWVNLSFSPASIIIKIQKLKLIKKFFPPRFILLRKNFPFAFRSTAQRFKYNIFYYILIYTLEYYLVSFHTAPVFVKLIFQLL